VSPSNYPSRFESPGVVPTWNYVAAEVRGRRERARRPGVAQGQVRDLTDQFETGSFAPVARRGLVRPSTSERQVSAIVGLEIDVTAIVGKAKLSQNRPEIDHDNVRDTFSEGTLGERNVSSRMTLEK
jgi:transcriptional regulator